jgi:putative colanic acid biosysnthesis UDP-glucose lipid carrier transferase
VIGQEKSDAPVMTNSTIAEKGLAFGTFGSGDHSIVAFVKRLTDPIVVQSTLIFCHLFYGYAITRSVLLLCILTFALTYPGSLPFRYRQIGLFGQILSGWLLVAFALSILGWSIRANDFLAMEPLITWAVATPFVIYTVHLLSPLIAPRLFKYQSVTSAIVIGVNDVSNRIIRTLNDDPLASTKIQAIFDDRSADRLTAPLDVPVVGNLKDIGAYVRTNYVGVIYICLPMASQPRILKLLDDLRDTTASIYFVPDVFVFDLMQARIDSVGGIPVLAVCESPFHGTIGLLKRWSDVAIAFAAIVLTSPLLIAVAIAVKGTSVGPIIFKQKRYGLDGRQIEVWKFRSMQIHEDSGTPSQAVVGDARVTPLGALLRRTSIDELPQFFNVLQGRMSVVGPRPHAVSHNEMYRRLISGYMIRHKVKPGITGWAQVNGARGETETIDKMERRVQLDLFYLSNWSLKLDFLIILKTIKTVIKGNNAY